MDTITDEKMTSKVCPFCKGKGAVTEVDAINADRTRVNPRPATCFVCDGFGSIRPEDEE